MIERRVYHLQGIKRWSVIPVYLLLRLWHATLRINIAPEARAILNQLANTHCVFYLWHRNLFIAPMVRYLRKEHAMYGLISASRDGAWLEALVNCFNIGAIRGSSTWHGRTALQESEEKIKTGDVVITPDGPQGPANQCKPGSLKWVYTQHYPTVAIHLEATRAWYLNTWDRFCIPKPFARITLKLHSIPSEGIDFDTFYQKVQQHL